MFHFPVNKCNFCLPLLGVLSGVKATLRLPPLVIPHSGTLRHDMTLVLALLFFYINTYQFVTPVYYPFWVAVRGKAKLKILALVSSYSEKPKLHYVSDFNLGSLHK